VLAVLEMLGTHGRRTHEQGHASALGDQHIAYGRVDGGIEDHDRADRM